MQRKILTFKNNYYGNCVLTPLQSKERLAEVLQNAEVVTRTSIGDHSNKTATEARINRLFKTVTENYEKHSFGFYEVYSGETYLGLAGFFCHHGNEGPYPEICIYLLPQHQKRGLASDMTSILIDHAFLSTDCTKVVADAYPENYSTSVINKYGFVKMSDDHQYKNKAGKQFGQIRYELSRSDRGLYLLSEIITKEAGNLVPITSCMVNENMERSIKIWYAYFRRGIMLSNGGSEHSIIQGDQLANNSNLEDFNMYRSDREDSVSISQDAIKKFMLEDSAISNAADLESISVGFSIGSHEGFTRIARCIHRIKDNNGMFYPVGGYGFLASAAATMEPVGYKVLLVDVDRLNGEKILLSDLKKLAKENPTAKTLFLEIKTMAGAIYSEDELTEIVSFCKKNDIFLIADIAHINMEFDKKKKFPDVVSISQKQKYHEFAVIQTCSKTYGLERARVAFITLSKKSKIKDLFLTIERDLYRIIGSGGDLPFEVANKLFNTPVNDRRYFTEMLSQKNRYNMNLMMAYIEGVESDKIDDDIRESIKSEIEVCYHKGIEGLRILHKPEGGIQMKIDTSSLQNKFLTNIRMSNSEIFSYALNKLAGVVTLHSYQIMDPNGFSMRLSFSVREDVKKGMVAIHNFVKSLSDTPTPNRFLPGIKTAEEIISSITVESKMIQIKKSQSNCLFFQTKKKINIAMFDSKQITTATRSRL